MAIQENGSYLVAVPITGEEEEEFNAIEQDINKDGKKLGGIDMSIYYYRILSFFCSKFSIR